MVYEVGGYIGTGEGWRPIIEPLIEMANHHKVKIFQIKEKFGTLRFYTAAPPGSVAARFHDAIYEAEKASGKICELCGQPGEISTDMYWMKTLCPVHMKEYINRGSFRDIPNVEISN